MNNASRLLVIVIVAAGFTGCSTVSEHLNPFRPKTPEIAYLGNRNDHALDENGNKTEKARAALEAMATYQSALPAQPNNPVIKPAIVRLMWIPDHLNSHGDLVPAHYYYLKVKGDQWAVKDAFELEGQLGPKSDSSSIPFVYGNQR